MSAALPARRAIARRPPARRRRCRRLGLGVVDAGERRLVRRLVAACSGWRLSSRCCYGGDGAIDDAGAGFSAGTVAFGYWRVIALTASKAAAGRPPAPRCPAARGCGGRFACLEVPVGDHVGRRRERGQREQGISSSPRETAFRHLAHRSTPERRMRKSATTHCSARTVRRVCSRYCGKAIIVPEGSRGRATAFCSPPA